MFDAYASDFLDDPYPTYARLRETAPVFFDETWGVTFVARHEDVTSVLRDREHFGRDFRHRLTVGEADPDLYERIYPKRWPTWTEYIRESFIDLEPPRHTRLRRLVSQAFTRRSSEGFRADLEAATDAILDRVLEVGSIEAIEELATPIPVAMIAELMGIPGEDHRKLIEWSHAIVRVFDTGVTEEEGDRAERSIKDFVSYVEGVLEQRRAQPGEDLISAMIGVEHEGDVLDDAEIVSTVILTLNAGHEATVHAIGNGLLALARNPGAYRDLRSAMIGVPTAVDELLRYDSPLQMFERWALADVEFRGQKVAKGTKVGLLFGSANHDPEVFAEPARIDLARDPNPHVSFGAGLHYCVGAPLAKVELEAALTRFAARVRSLEVETAGPRIPSLVFRGVESLRLSIEAA